MRMAIGIGDETFVGSTVSESNGPAYQRSGRKFEALKERKINLAIGTGDSFRDYTLKPYDAACVGFYG